MSRACVICGAGIEGSPIHWRTCSIRCSAIFRRDENRKRLSAYRAGRIKRRTESDHPRVCQYCGSSIEHMHMNARTCSKHCYDQIDNAHMRAARQANWQTRNCAVCEGPVEKKSYQINTCSDMCKRKYRLEYARNYYNNFGRNPQKSEERKEYTRHYRDRNLEKIRARESKYRQDNKDRLRQVEKERRDTNGDMIRARARDRYHERAAALKVIREIEAKGLEALL